jgi:hypothetical protein
LIKKLFLNRLKLPVPAPFVKHVLPISKCGMVPFYFFREGGHLLAMTLAIFNEK